MAPGLCFLARTLVSERRRLVRGLGRLQVSLLLHASGGLPNRCRLCSRAQVRMRMRIWCRLDGGGRRLDANLTIRESVARYVLVFSELELTLALDCRARITVGGG